MKIFGGQGAFPRLFWTVNTLELFERGAYYGMLAMLPYHLVFNLHFATTAFGVLLGVLTPFLYLLPIVSSALAQKYGFRPALLIAFVLIASGYGASGMMTTFESMMVAFILFGAGMGIFKPIISASIAHTTSESNRNLGYSIYYWVINVGAFSMPLLISFAFPKETYGLVFFLSTGLICANLVLAFLFYRNPTPPDPSRSIGNVLTGAALVLKDVRFVILLLIYSGFWFVYSMNHLAILLYALDFNLIQESWFPPSLIAVFNPGTIIALGLGLGKLVEKYDSLKCMVVGITIVILGFLTLGLTTNPWVFIGGIVIFSIGEFVTHPTYIAYVSKIAPKEKLPVYMGYAFIPPLIGLSTGNVLGALLYKMLSEEMHRPKFFWACVCAIGILTIAMLLLYSQTLGRKAREDRMTAEERANPVPSHPFWDSKLPVIAALLIIPGLVGGAYAGGTDAFSRTEDDLDEDPWKKFNVTEGEKFTISGNSAEATQSDVPLTIPEANLISATFTLTWTDEPDMQRMLRTYENQPDEFGLVVNPPGGSNGTAPPAKNLHGQEGKLILTVDFGIKKPEKGEPNNTFVVTVQCGQCGDFTARASLVAYTDTGNVWSLNVEYQYYARK